MNQGPSLPVNSSVERDQRTRFQRQKLPPLELGGAHRYEKRDTVSDTQKNTKPKNQSFSDMLAPDQVHTVIDLSLEKELENHKQAAQGGTMNKLEKSK
mgnify:CR=1 FL=1